MFGTALHGICSDKHQLSRRHSEKNTSVKINHIGIKKCKNHNFINTTI